MVIIFKNNVKWRVIKKYKTYDSAIERYNRMIDESKKVLFDVQTQNGNPVVYELALLKKSRKSTNPIYRVDNIGRNVVVSLDDPEFAIAKITPYKVEEKLFDISKNKKVSVHEIINLINKNKTLKLVSKINHKIVIQDDDNVNLFSAKTLDDADRFLDFLENHMLTINQKNCMIIRDISVAQKKYLYEFLASKGYSKQMLWRKTTAYSSKR